MSLQHELEPRDVLPYSDEEIRELYLAAQPKPIEEEALSEVAQSWVAIVDACSICLVLYAAIAATVAALAGTAAALWVSAMAFAVGATVVGRLYGKSILGPLSLILYRRAIRRERERRRNIDPCDLGVLRTVVDHIAEGPMQQALQIVRSVDAMRERIVSSLQELPEIASALQDEIAATRDEGLRTLLRARHSAALEACERLRSLDRELERQAADAVEAVTPIRELREKFDRVRKLSGNLARIQAAHGLVDDARQSVEDHHVQLRLLRATAQAASAKLREIQSIVEANEQARTEIASL